ncbi:MAG: GNAT family N-acetyltransferase [Paludibacteraceae bacterium]|nr:GNAT family N-acetyltransferase [Paludibacteraceae bacterium]
MITLRKLEPTDVPFLYQWENDALSWPNSDNHNPLSQQDLRAYVESTTGDIYRDGQLRMVICQEGASVGCIDLYDFDARNRKAGVGIYIAPAFRKQGAASEALKKIEDYAFDFLHLRQVYAFTAVKNADAVHLFEKAGYLPSARLIAWTIESDAILWQKVRL